MGVFLLINDAMEILLTFDLLVLFLFIDIKFLKKNGNYAYGLGKARMGEAFTAIYIIYLIYKFFQNHIV